MKKITGLVLSAFLFSTLSAQADDLTAQGIKAYRAGDYAKAEQLYKQAIEAESDNTRKASIYRNLSILYTAEGKDGSEYSRKADELDPPAKSKAYVDSSGSEMILNKPGTTIYGANKESSMQVTKGGVEVKADPSPKAFDAGTAREGESFLTRGAAVKPAGAASAHLAPGTMQMSDPIPMDQIPDSVKQSRALQEQARAAANAPVVTQAPPPSGGGLNGQGSPAFFPTFNNSYQTQTTGLGLGFSPGRGMQIGGQSNSYSGYPGGQFANPLGPFGGMTSSEQTSDGGSRSYADSLPVVLPKPDGGAIILNAPGPDINATQENPDGSTTTVIKQTY